RRRDLAARVGLEAFRHALTLGQPPRTGVADASREPPGDRARDLRAAAVQRDDALPLRLALLVDFRRRLIDHDALVRARLAEELVLAVGPDDLHLARRGLPLEPEVGLRGIL